MSSTPKDDKNNKDSIFVCFMCEKEFKDIRLLEKHMSIHDEIPEMIPEVIAGRKRKKKEHIDKKVRIIKSQIARATEIEQKIRKKKSDSTSNSNDIISSAKKPTELSPKKAEKRVLTSEELAIRRAMRLKKSISLPPKVEKKVATAEELAIRRAMRIKNYVQSKEDTSNKQTSKAPDELSQETIMMVDSGFFDGTDSFSLGPTVMNAEPDGFICPIPASKFKTKKELFNEKMREQFAVDKFDVETENQNQNNYSDEEEEENSSSSDEEFRINRKPVKRGRGRPPLSNRRKHDGRPGRRSQPRDAEQVGSYQCTECFKQYSTLTTMKVHRKSHFENKSIQCPYCPEVFPQRYILYDHLVQEHEGCSNLTCPVCNKVFTRSDSLKSHMVRMHEDEGGLNCIVCGKNFPSQAQLEMHIRVHTGERPFKCELCDKGFVQKIHLRTHLRTMHNTADAPTTPCRMCGKMFENRVQLKEHIRCDHNLTNDQYKNRIVHLRREGMLSDKVPPKVRVVDPTFRYKKVSASELPVPEKSSTVRTVSGDGRLPVFITEKKKKFRIKKHKNKRKACISSAMGTILSNDDLVMFSPSEFQGRDQEELNLVESAFKVADEMDQLSENGPAIILPGDPLSLDAADASSTKSGQIIQYSNLDDIGSDKFIVVDGFDVDSKDKIDKSIVNIKEEKDLISI